MLSGSGYVVTGDKYISIGVRVPGRIDATSSTRARRVEAGQPLVQLDDRDYEAALARRARAWLRARANVALGRKELERARSCSGAGRALAGRSRREGERAARRRGGGRGARAEIDAGEVDLDYTVLRAPTDGVILAKLKEVGEIAVPGGFAGSGDLIRMANLDDLRAEVDVNEADLARVQLGQPAEVMPDAYPDRRYAAKVVKLYPQVNRQKGTLKVEVKILEPDEWLRPDMSVRITFLAEASPAARASRGAAVLAPRAALRRTTAAPFVWVVTSGALRRQAVEPAGDRGDRVVIAKGLAGGEALVVGDAEGLREGRASKSAD